MSSGDYNEQQHVRGHQASRSAKRAAPPITSRSRRRSLKPVIKGRWALQVWLRMRGSSSRSRLGATWPRRRALNRVAQSVFPGRLHLSHRSLSGQGSDHEYPLLPFPANSFLEPIWNRNYISSVQITLSETFGVGKRGAFYESAGAACATSSRIISFRSLRCSSPWSRLRA